jgi:hypothetical protein
MFGIKHMNFDSMTYVIHFRKGNVIREGRGLSFFYFEPESSIVAIPISSNNLPFIFSELTNDYQTVSIQGQISYRIKSPKALADVLDFTISSNGLYKKNDIEKLNNNLVNEAQASISSFIHNIKLKESIRSAKIVENTILTSLVNASSIETLGIEILGVNILAIKATPEMTRALETETREKVLQEADQAIYERRNFAVEQERKIKESELSTEIAVEEKKKQIDEKKMESEILRTENERKIREMKLDTEISIENQRKNLIQQRSLNEMKEADVQQYKMDAALKPYKDFDWKLLTAINNNNDPKYNISLAFRELAENSQRIGNLNISPDLLEAVIGNQKDPGK